MKKQFTLCTIFTMAFLAGCAPGGGIPEGADFNNPDRPVGDAPVSKETEQSRMLQAPSTTQPAASEEQAKAILEKVQRGEIR